MPTTETIRLDNAQDLIRRSLDFDLVVPQLTAWGETFTCHFEYNDVAEFWVWYVSQQDIGTLIPRSVVQVDKVYRAEPYIIFRFITPEDDTISEVTPANLGSDVLLSVSPGPLGGSFLTESGYSEAEANELSKRDQYLRLDLNSRSISGPISTGADQSTPIPDEYASGDDNAS